TTLKSAATQPTSDTRSISNPTARRLSHCKTTATPARQSVFRISGFGRGDCEARAPQRTPKQSLSNEAQADKPDAPCYEAEPNPNRVSHRGTDYWAAAFYYRRPISLTHRATKRSRTRTGFPTGGAGHRAAAFYCTVRAARGGRP